MPGPDWDSRYADAPDGLFGGEVNAFVAEALGAPGRTGARVLCLADGDGRNGRWLAKRGWHVTAVDVSSVATRNGERLDASAGVSVDRRVCDLSNGLPDGLGAFDAAALIYLQAPWFVRQQAIVAGLGALASGGRLIIEGFAKWPSPETQSLAPLGPTQAELRYATDELSEIVTPFQIACAETLTTTLNEGERHQGQAFVMRAVLRRD